MICFCIVPPVPEEDPDSLHVSANLQILTAGPMLIPVKEECSNYISDFNVV